MLIDPAKDAIKGEWKWWSTDFWQEQTGNSVNW